MSSGQSQPDPFLPLPRYRRKRAVEDQIRALPPVETLACLNYVRALGGSLFPETLVWLFRAAQYRHRDLAEAVMDQLLGRADLNGRFQKSVRLVIWRQEIALLWMELETYLVRRAGRRGIAKDFDEMDEFRALAHRHILLKMQRSAEEMPFWEVYFSLALRTALRDVIREMERSLDVPARLHPGTTPIDPNRLHHGGLSPDEVQRRALALERVMSLLPDRERRVVELLFMDPTAPNGKRTQKEVAEIMGVTERTVYNHLQRIRARLKDDPRLAEIRELDAMADEGDSPRSGGEFAETTHE